MIPFNLVFRKQPLSEARSLTSDCQSKTAGSELANSLSLSVLKWVGLGGGRCGRCRRLTLQFNLYAGGGGSGGQDGVIIASWLSVLMGHSSPVELQMRRKGGLAGMAASPICLTCSSGGSSSINRPLMSFIEHKGWLPQPEAKNGSRHKRTRHARLSQSLPRRVLGAQRLHFFLLFSKLSRLERG